jgi:Tfp pilus assembly protein PilV
MQIEQIQMATRGGDRQRGVTMVSVMLLTIALLTIGMLAVRSSVREITQAGQLVARERAVMAAQAAVDLAAAQYMRMEDPARLNAALAGYNPQGETCTDPCGDCIPGGLGIVTGQRNEMLQATTGCGGRPCMRQGAVAFLVDENQTEIPWCDVPMRDLFPGADSEARVSVWIRNNAGDALGAAGSGSWTEDGDGRIVLTAMATLRNTTVTVEQELMLSGAGTPAMAQPVQADEGYGGGHNNDNSTVAMCADNFVQANGG